MKYLTAFILLISIALSACKKDAVRTDYDKCYTKWLEFKAVSNNSYSYIAYSSLAFGNRSETKLTIQNGKIIARDYVASRYKPGTSQTEVFKSWAESGATLNTHSDGYELLTLDQVYSKAKTEWLQADKKGNDIYFEAKNNGMLSSAGYVPKGCMDDCFTGINIKEIKVYVKEIK